MYGRYNEIIGILIIANRYLASVALMDDFIHVSLYLCLCCFLYHSETINVIQ